MFFAEDMVTPPPGMASWAACAAFAVFTAERARALYLSMQPRPAMDRQLRDLEHRLDARLDTLSKEMNNTFATKSELDAAQEFNAEARSHKMEQIQALTKRIEDIAGSMTSQWEQRMRDLTKKLDDFSLEITNKVGEIRGEQRRMK